jgi:hypothetical protein
VSSTSPRDGIGRQLFHSSGNAMAMACGGLMLDGKIFKNCQKISDGSPLVFF